MNKIETESELKEKEMSKSALELTVLLKTGESKQFIKAFDTNKTCVTLDNLHKNCVVLQKEVNDFLTTLVEQERGVSGVNNASKANESIEDNDLNDEDEDDDDDDDDEEDECSVNSQGPQCKRLKQ